MLCIGVVLSVTLMSAPLSFAFGACVKSGPYVPDLEPCFENGFHYPEAPEELALDAVLTIEFCDQNLHSFVTGYEKRDKRHDRRFSAYFSAELLGAWTKAELEAVQRNCNGVYVEGDMCGVDVNISCAQDYFEGGNVYKTETSNGNTAIISYRWPHFTDVIATYRMVRNGHRWIMDGVSCSDGLKFNMD